MILKIPNLRPCLRLPPPPVPPPTRGCSPLEPRRCVWSMPTYLNIRPLEAMPGSPEARCPSEIGHMALDPVTPGSGPGDLTEFEVPVVETGIRHEGLASSGLCADDPPARCVRSCVEVPGYARGWVPEPSPTHSTMLYTMMQVDRSPEAQAVHG